jgi:hypothetical protein
MSKTLAYFLVIARSFHIGMFSPLLQKPSLNGNHDLY